MCQVVLESNAEDQEELVFHEAPNSSIALPHTSSVEVHVDGADHSPALPCHPLPQDCTIPGSPDFFLPANACIALDDPSCLPPSSYSTTPSPTSWLAPSLPPSATTSLQLDCPSLFSTGSSSHHDAGFFCDQIHALAYGPAADHSSSNASAVSFDHPPLPRHLALYGHHSSTLNGSFHYMLQGSDPPYYHHGSNQFGAAYLGSDHSLHHNVARSTIDFAPANHPLYPHPHGVDARINMLHQGIAAGDNEQEQGWYNFLQHDQEEHMTAHPESEAMEGSTLASGNAVMVSDSHHHLAHGVRAAHPCMPMIGQHHHSMGNPNARSPAPEQMQLDTAFTCGVTPSNKRRILDGEGQDSWPSADAHACSPPLKMRRSPSLSSSTTGPVDLHTRNASPNYINTYNMNDKFGGAATSCNSATLSPPTQKPAITPSASPTNRPDHHQKKPTKASSRQSVCNDPQSVAARHRRERISERLKTLQQLVPNGSKVDLVTMLEKAISYVKSLQLQVKVLSTDEYWPTSLSDKYSLNNLAVVAKLAASTYS